MNGKGFGKVEKCKEWTRLEPGEMETALVRAEVGGGCEGKESCVVGSQKLCPGETRIQDS